MLVQNQRSRELISARNKHDNKDLSQPTVTHLACVQMQGTSTPPEVHSLPELRSCVKVEVAVLDFPS